MDSFSPDSLIQYDEIVQAALRTVVGRVLEGINSNLDLPGGHHFYITFLTRAPGVSMPKHLYERFPEEMTVVLQNKFWDLNVSEEGFEVHLTFNQIGTRLFIPFNALTVFHDPAVDFQLQFHANIDDDLDFAVEDAPKAARPAIESDDGSDDGSNVVTVDFGRKK